MTMHNLEVYKNVKVLEVKDDFFIRVKGYRLYKFYFDKNTYEYVGRINDGKYALFACYFLTRRFLRAEVTNLYGLPSGDYIAIAKKGVFLCKKGEQVFRKTFNVLRGSRPMNLCITPDSNIYFGEYFANVEKRAVNIYHSSDNGKTWNIVYTFKEGTINHIHGLFWDSYTNCIWVTTGDLDNECIIANTQDGFKTLNIIFRGGQKYRATNLFFYKDFIIYATDSQYIINSIYKINRKDFQVDTLYHIQGSAIKGGQNGNLAYFSTTVEPSKINRDKYSHLWMTQDGLTWREIYKAKKDWLPAIFQFGSIEFPKNLTNKGGLIMFSGRALTKIGNNSCKIVL